MSTSLMQPEMVVVPKAARTIPDKPLPFDVIFPWVRRFLIVAFST